MFNSKLLYSFKERRIIQIAKNLPEWFTDEGVDEIAYDLLRHETITISLWGRIVGFVIYQILDDSAHIKWMAVDPLFHRRKIGSGLIAKLKKICVSKKIKEIRVVTLGEGDPYVPYVGTRAFYKMMQFQPIKVTKTENLNFSEELELRLIVDLEKRSSHHVKMQTISNRNSSKSRKVWGNAFRHNRNI